MTHHNYRPCANSNCARPMRTSHQPANQHPGTVIYGGNNKCRTCHLAEQRGENMDTFTPHKRADPINPANVARAAMMLQLMSIERRRRGILT